MIEDRDGYEVRFKKYGTDEYSYSLWIYTESYTEATTECEILIKKDFVESVKLMRVKSVQVFRIDTNEHDK